MSKYVVVITGGRKGSDRERARRELGAYDPATTLIRHGGAPGWDSVVAHVAEDMGFEVQEVRARWSDPCGPQCNPGHRKERSDGSSYCPMAGFVRNQLMLDMDADELHAFPGENGTTDTVNRAKRMGIKHTGWDPLDNA